MRDSAEAGKHCTLSSMSRLSPITTANLIAALASPSCSITCSVGSLFSLISTQASLASMRVCALSHREEDMFLLMATSLGQAWYLHLQLVGEPGNSDAIGAEMSRILLPPMVTLKWSRMRPFGRTCAISSIPASPVLRGTAVSNCSASKISQVDGGKLIVEFRTVCKK
jgi:hypothetical protein